MNRRDFLKMGGLGALSLLAMGTMAGGEAAAAACRRMIWQRFWKK